MAAIDGYQALASVYMGHQFGVPVPRLGDGRAILIAEHQTSNSETRELQLKGAGQTLIQEWVMVWGSITFLDS